MSSFWNSFNNGFMFGMMRNLPFFGYFNNCFCNFNFGYYMPSLILPPLPSLSIFNSVSNGFAPSPILQNLPDFNLPKFEAQWNVQNYELPKFNFNNQIGQTNFQNIQSFNSSVMTPSVVTTPDVKSSVNVHYSTNLSGDEKFKLMLKEVLKSESGYVENDAGAGPCNRGVLQTTYDKYRKNKKLPKNNVKNITNEEINEIYYDMYFKASGADKISNPELAFYVFDTAVNMGVGKAKEIYEKSGNDANKFKQIRISEYKRIAQNPNKSKYLKGWLNRVEKNTAFVKNNFTQNIDAVA